jgi:hypothetical protein
VLSQGNQIKAWRLRSPAVFGTAERGAALSSRLSIFDEFEDLSYLCPLYFGGFSRLNIGLTDTRRPEESKG